MIFNHKILTPDMTDWHVDPDTLVLEDAESQLEKMSCHYDKPLCVFIGGAMDDVYRPLLNGVFVPYRLQSEERHDSVYATHGAIKSVMALMHKWHSCKQTVCLIGHSWGGQTALDVARNTDQKIALLVTLDPVSMRFKNNHQSKPENVERWVNISVDYAKASHERSNIIARIGGYWGDCKHADANIKLNKKNNIEVTHARADLMFAEVRHELTAI